MPAFIDLAGASIGKWTVLYRDVNKGPGAWWVCRCDPERGGCGQEYAVNGLLLRRAQRGEASASTQCRACAGRGNSNKAGKSHTAETRERQSVAMRAAAADPDILLRLRANIKCAQAERRVRAAKKAGPACRVCGAAISGAGRRYCDWHRPK